MTIRRLALLGFAATLAATHLVQRELRAVAQPPVEPPAAIEPQSAAPPELPPAGALAIPVLGVEKSALRDDFGAPRGAGRRHSAIDILAPRGTPVVAAADGTVLKLFRSRAGGLTLYLADAAGRNVYYYAHLDRYADGLREGAAIARGTVVGFVGTTGNAPPDVPHLHFGFETLPPGGEWWKGKPENPYPLLQERGYTVR